jgi:hypothetical protein
VCGGGQVGGPPIPTVRIARVFKEKEVKKFRSVALVVGLVLVGYTTLTFLGTAASGTRAQTIPSKVVDDQVAQYNLAVRAGSKTDRCVQAGFVASAYVQVKDEPNREEWDRIRQGDCEAAGLTP